MGEVVLENRIVSEQFVIVQALLCLLPDQEQISDVFPDALQDPLFARLGNIYQGVQCLCNPGLLVTLALGYYSTFFSLNNGLKVPIQRDYILSQSELPVAWCFKGCCSPPKLVQEVRDFFWRDDAWVNLGSQQLYRV